MERKGHNPPLNCNLQVRALSLIELFAIGAEALTIAVFGEGNEGSALDGGNAVKDGDADVGLGIVIVQVHLGVIEGVGDGGTVFGGLQGKGPGGGRESQHIGLAVTAAVQDCDHLAAVSVGC